jgi:NADH:ubiquinone oxidoreductase subunit 5 (subunit L)/multisubunit Na+/H+ antiporter MnhA subunit
MEGPTPVSALLHAATMVTAGIFLLLKCHVFITISTETIFISQILTIWGLFTAFFAACIASVQTDIKKIIAYSTCSQLGFMLLMIGQYQYNLSFFHLFNHGFFKALLFLSAGIVIHGLHNNQDTRFYGNLQKILPLLYILNLIGVIAITGFPFLSGFYSKDLILEITYLSSYLNNNILYWLSLLTTSLTAYYSYKIVLIMFRGSNKNIRHYLEQIHYPSLLIIGPVMILSICSLFLGYLSSELFIGLGLNTFNFFILPEMSYIALSEYLPLYIKLIPFFISLSSLGLILLISKFFYKLILNHDKKNYQNHILQQFFNIRLFMGYKFYIDIFYNSLFIFFYKYSYFIYKLIDKQFIEILLIKNIVKLIKNVYYFLISFNTGLIHHYLYLLILYIFFCLILLIN